jgi:hypothetical protein
MFGLKEWWSEVGAHFLLTNFVDKCVDNLAK